MKYLERCNKGNTLSNKYKITPDGFRFLNESTHMLSPSNSVFCAMWFNAKTEELYNIGIKPAIKQANLEPIKMDEEVFTEDIIAQMILRINNSKLVVADLTGQRPSVYYEAGYAQAKGLKVIFTCQKGENAHFDVNHYPIVYWESDNLQKFQNELYSRIIKITT